MRAVGFPLFLTVVLYVLGSVDKSKETPRPLRLVQADQVETPNLERKAGE